MAEFVRGDDHEPPDRIPAGLLYVPVRSGPAGCATRLFRTPLGGRTAVGFTTQLRLTDTLGAEQAWIRISEPALRALTEPLGATTLTVDPQLAAPATTRTSRASLWREWDPQTIGVLRVTGAVALVDAVSMWIG
ncbi:SAV_915 family protein [Streptomyces sp. RPT161]|uniref:SAV_915 family protein n=1 Tax=Streptomyces sp. RPT161 TaxID=3015993 RepID=UPI0022B88143|nr:SAV_915 family protein [Streptomyces sp. RPT161]